MKPTAVRKEVWLERRGPLRARTSKRVLIVEDDEQTRKELVELLHVHGHAVVAACNGLEGLIAGMRMAQASEPPEVILLDLMMPVMDGPTFRLQQLRIPVLALIPVVVVSGFPDLAIHSGAMKAAAYFKKPFDASSLLQILEDVSEVRH